MSETLESQQKLTVAEGDEASEGVPTPAPLSVGIVGAGISGLTAALLIKCYLPNYTVKIFEATDRVGGRIHTYRFSDEPFQYFEAGAMRIPLVEEQKHVFDLIAYLNMEQPEYPLKVIPFHVTSPGNRVFVNGTKQKDGKVMSVEYADDYPQELGFPAKAGASKRAKRLLRKALEPVIKKMHKNFDKAVKKYDKMTLHYYLSHELGWPEEKINYVEVMTSQTNEFQTGLIEQAMQQSYFIDLDDQPTEWKTIDGGLSRLPEAAAKFMGEENIVRHAPISAIAYLADGRVTVGYTKSGTAHEETFDAVILALPPSSVRMIPKRPRWAPEFEHCLRSIHFQPLYKLGLRFKSRFWERQELRQSLGGMSITDLPSRWVVYPSYGIGDKGKGVLLMFSLMTDSQHWLAKSKEEKVMMALQDLQKLYPKPEVDIFEEYAGGSDPRKPSFLEEAIPFVWGVKYPGDANFYAGQFASFHEIMVQPQGNIYFAGEHLSRTHSWVAGALDSAHHAVQQLCDDHTHGTTIEFFKINK